MTANKKPIPTEKMASHLREKAIDIEGQRVLISRLVDTAQEKDLTVPANCNGYGRIRHFRQATADGWPANPLPIAPACRALNITAIPDCMEALVFQNAACAWRCWYCFVPENLLRADKKHSEWFTAEQLIDLYIQIPDRPQIIDLSGGSPDLVPEWTPWMMRALIDKGLENTTYLWTDDNLSTTYLFDELSSKDLDLLCNYKNYGRVCCIKGFDSRSFEFNTLAESQGYDRQFEILKQVVDLGIDVYGYVTLTSPFDDGVSDNVRNLMDRLQSIDPNFPLRVVPLRIEIYTPVEKRVNKDAEREKSLEIQEQAIEVWVEEIQKRFLKNERAKLIYDVPLTPRKA